MEMDGVAAMGRMERAQVVGAALAALMLGLLVVLDLMIPPDYAVLTALFGLVPLIACAVVPAWGTAGFAVVALSAAVASGVWNDTLWTPQHTVRVLNVPPGNATIIAAGRNDAAGPLLKLGTGIVPVRANSITIVQLEPLGQ